MPTLLLQDPRKRIKRSLYISLGINLFFLFAIGVLVCVFELSPLAFMGLLGIEAILRVISMQVLMRRYINPMFSILDALRDARLRNVFRRLEVQDRAHPVRIYTEEWNEWIERVELLVEQLRALEGIRSDFLSTVSHELRTPLTSVLGYLKLILNGDVGPVEPQQREFLEIVHTNMKRLLQLVNDLLDVEKMEAGRLQVRKEPIELLDVLQECVNTFDVLAQEKEVEFRFEPNGLNPTVLGDSARLVQVFMNLISNAIKYTPKGGSVLVDLMDDASWVEVRVKDSGIGISNADKERLFQKFFRTKEALDSNEGGTGLGLVIVRELVEGHGGTIVIASEQGRGTTVSVRLPQLKS